jgi:transcriptional regulator with XRE-family HTH domain
MAVDVATLVNLLKIKREAEGLSLRGLSSIIGVSFSSLARIERGEGQPDNNSMIRILEWLGQDGKDADLTFEDVALVHFRANKNIQSRTVGCLMKIAEMLKLASGVQAYRQLPTYREETFTNSALPDTLSLSKADMEERALNLREQVGVGPDAPLDALDIEIEGVNVLVPSEIVGLDQKCLDHLYGAGAGEWSAMSVPLDEVGDAWAIVRNDQHSMVRQKVTYLEECWHILQGHRLTKIAKISESYGRTYDSDEENEAYYLAGATLVPGSAVVTAVNAGKADLLAATFDVSQQLIEYRIKRLGLWSTYKGKAVTIAPKGQS